MPSYDYACPGCGGFTADAPMSRYAEPSPCPGCLLPAPRTLTAPYYATADASPPAGERADAPRSHASGCGCCGIRAPSAPGGQRPRMIAH